VTVCHLINLGYWNHRKLKWDPQAWTFPGDAEANSWLHTRIPRNLDLAAVLSQLL